MKDKITQIIQFLKTKFIFLDTKISALIPNSKIKKILYIGVGSLLGLMILIILLGMLVKPISKSKIESKINIANTPEPTKNSTVNTSSEVDKIRIQIENLQFPEKTLNIPVIQSGFDVVKSEN